jgi:hypothetical protein
LQPLADEVRKVGIEMKRVLLGLLFAVTAALLAPVAASAATYETFVGCDDFAENPVPAHVCQVGDFPGAFFESDANTEYEVCVEFPTGEVFCSEEELAEAEILYVNSIFGDEPSDEPGDYLVGWFVEGAEIGSWAFRLDPPPPPPPAAPVAVAPPAQPPVIVSTVSVECLKAQRRVGALKGRLRNTKGRSQKAKVRSKLKNARATANRVC